MSLVVLLDSAPLGELVNPRLSVTATEWAERIVRAGGHILVPAIVYYELRRELVRIASTRSVSRLDALAERFEIIDVSVAVLKRASDLWARARTLGLPTAPDRALDVDVILAASAEIVALDRPGDDVVVATSNVGHLARFVSASPWHEIHP